VFKNGHSNAIATWTLSVFVVVLVMVAVAIGYCVKTTRASKALGPRAQATNTGLGELINKIHYVL